MHQRFSQASEESGDSKAAAKETYRDNCRFRPQTYATRKRKQISAVEDLRSGNAVAMKAQIGLPFVERNSPIEAVSSDYMRTLAIRYSEERYASSIRAYIEVVVVSVARVISTTCSFFS